MTHVTHERVGGFGLLDPKVYNAATEGPKSWPVLVPGHKGSQQNPVQPIKCRSTNTIFVGFLRGWCSKRVCNWGNPKDFLGKVGES